MNKTYAWHSSEPGTVAVDTVLRSIGAALHVAPLVTSGICVEVGVNIVLEKDLFGEVRAVVCCNDTDPGVGSVRKIEKEGSTKYIPLNL